MPTSGPLQVEERARPGGGELGRGLRLRFPSEVALAEQAVEVVAAECFAGIEASQRSHFRLRTVLLEALVNAIQCGNGGDPAKLVEVDVDVLMDRIRLTVTDQGEGFDPARTPDPLHPEMLSAPCGRGLFIIRHLALEVGFNDKGNAIWMILPRS